MKELLNNRIEYQGLSSDSGKCCFTLYWLEYQDGANRLSGLKEVSQNFFANPRIWGFPKPESATSTDIKIGQCMKEINHAIIAGQ